MEGLHALLFLVIGVFGSSEASNDMIYGTVFYDPSSQQYTLKNGYDATGAAFGYFNDTADVSGWGILKIQTNSKEDDNVQMFAAGYLEGALTSDRIYQNYENMYQYFFSPKQPPTAKLMDFLAKQDSWVRTQIKNNAADNYWKQVSYITSQFDGLVAGYGDHANTPLKEFAFQMLNGVGDLLDLIGALDTDQRINWKDLTKEERLRTLGMKGHCSVLIKVPGDLSDIWSGHSAWFTYGAMNRIFKHYYLNLNAPFVASRMMSFSSYPGFLESLDDFYMMPDSGLEMLQTTISIMNDTLYQYVKPESLFAWQRVRLSNSMARNGNEWGELFSQHNSGTYNNEYMIIDYNRIEIGQQLLDGALTVVDQIPGLVIYADQTQYLSGGYFASYNVPFYQEVYNLSGFSQYSDPGLTWQMAPRAKIFRRDQGNVVDLDSYKAIMRYNNYKEDPYSDGDPGNAICARFDLGDNFAAGCIDTKVTSYQLYKQMQAHAISGPTTSHNLPVFSWSTSGPLNSTLHMGQPNSFDFDFIVMDPMWS
eukprot:TRINITY_DN10983_c0_g1_i1.p1 TRINITY_DN10983_c0_g1~~TRINITY_DN10983_c0_g1_i1.p1  ORF type:complete len:545 (+),score=120.02 TRINITY_DN10983_c0_g1_i1:36-1637(+)